MLEWLLLPIDSSRPHTFDGAMVWHGRLMVLAWGVLAPAAVLLARFGKILPRQRWPEELDSQVWWVGHWVLQSVVAVLSVAALWIMWTTVSPGYDSYHALFGWCVTVLLAAQVLSGVLRGTKGGPTCPARDGSLRGDHYDMTPWRRAFETLHKTSGYTVLALSVFAVLTGLWHANAPHWMWLGLVGWWATLLVAFAWLQSRGLAVDTYQAIWGPDATHPGNQMPSQGWKTKRHSGLRQE